MRYNFSKRKTSYSPPNLIGIQLDSYAWLKSHGISEVLDEMGEIKDQTGRGWLLTLAKPSFDKPAITLDHALNTGKDYSAPWYLEATIQDPITTKTKTQKVYMGDLPIMTPSATFIINGSERVVINQIRRAEGVLFTKELHSATGQSLGGAKILPKNGVWLEFDTAKTGVISVKIDRKRKIAATVLLRIFGLATDDEIRAAFTKVDINPEVSFIEATLAKDPTASYNEAVLEIYKKVRPGEPLVLENARTLITNTFFDVRRFSLGNVGRFKLNQVLGLSFPNDKQHQLIQLEDLIKVIAEIITINNNKKQPSDVDNLSNRRVRSVGELLQDEIRLGFLRMERNIRERMSLHPRETLPEPASLISQRTVASSIHSFFATGQLSQHHDQANPLTAIDHLRRLSVLGPGGLSKERASFAVRDVHYSSFGKICPVRTPEGTSVGLINYLATYAKPNEYGFLETPYLKLEKTADGRVRVTDKIEYLAAYDEEDVYITDSSVHTDTDGYILETQVPLKKGEDTSFGHVSNAQYIELVPAQAVGVVAGLIPFLPNDDISRALMGTQQLSQTVPLVKPEAPIVGTGVEEVVARSSGIVQYAEHDGEVVYADSRKVSVRYKGQKEVVDYSVRKFKQSNAFTSYNQYVRVTSGQKISQGDILFEGPASVNGELALGVNLVTAYMNWHGYEYEDGVIISDRLVKEDILTSVYIDTFSVQILETKLGPEEITADIPNAPEETLRNLGEDGIVVVGAEVRGGDILVGKVAPRGEVELSAEERLLRAIFGEKAKEVRDTSLVLPHGKRGIVIEVKRVTRKDNNNLPTGVIEEIKVTVAVKKKIQVGDKLAGRHGNKGVISAIVPVFDMPYLEDGTPIDIILSSEAVLKRMNVGQILEAPLSMAGRKLGRMYTVSNFEPIPYDEINGELNQAEIPTSSKVNLIDGATGEYFDDKVVVGETYIIKLVHMSEEKMHARSTGPYSLITQQPLGGKAQMGGQRLGEMEVWALEAYGAAHTLKEMLTIKSDDWLGRNKAYKAILQNQPIPESNVPASFKLLVRELNGLALGIAPVGVDPTTPIEADEEEPYRTVDARHVGGRTLSVRPSKANEDDTAVEVAEAENLGFHTVDESDSDEPGGSAGAEPGGEPSEPVTSLEDNE